MNTTITLRRRDFTITRRDSDVVPYTLTTARGAVFELIRNLPTGLLIAHPRKSNALLDGVRLTDKGGDLAVVCG